MHRGEVWWAFLPPPIGRRPVLLLSREAVYQVRSFVTVGVVTRTVRGIPTEVSLGPEDGMPARCVANLDNILTIPKDQLVEQITTLSTEKMSAVAEAIAFALDLG